MRGGLIRVWRTGWALRFEPAELSGGGGLAVFMDRLERQVMAH